MRRDNTAGRAARRHNDHHADTAERGAERPLPAQISKLRPSPNSGPGVTMRTYNTSTPTPARAPTTPDANASSRYTHSAPALRTCDDALYMS